MSLSRNLGYFSLAVSLFVSQRATAQFIPARYVPVANAPFHEYGVDVHVASLGYGGDIVTNLLPTLNLRFSGSGANYGFLDPSRDGVIYKLHYRPRVATLDLDAYPMTHGRAHNLFFTVGVVLSTHDFVTGKLTAPAGQLFTLNHTVYRNSSTDPIYSTVAFGSSRTAYTFGIGYGNLLRPGSSFTLTASAGIIALGEPKARTYPAGSICAANGTNCREVSSDPSVLANTLAEVQGVAANHTVFQFVPNVYVGIGYRFHRSHTRGPVQ